MREKLLSLESDLNKVLLGKAREVRILIIALISGGHLLIEDKPGVGKTTLVQALAKLMDLDCKRVQFTSDLLPADIVGNFFLNPKTQDLQFRKGPLFTQIFLADELNRANPRTQSALLQAMEEGVISVDGVDQKLEEPFMVIATQNPQTQVGTFALPESQLDRFLISMNLDYADAATEVSLIASESAREKLKSLEAKLSAQDWQRSIGQTREVKLSQTVAQYVQALLVASREHMHMNFSTRAGIALAQACRSLAYLENRDYVTQDDVQYLAPYVLGHRCSTQGEIKKGHAEVKQLVEKTPVTI